MNMNRDKTVTTKTNQMGYGPTIGEMRLSRLGHPRASLFAIVLLAAVFLLFGLFASAAASNYSPAPNTIDGAVALIGDWVLVHSGITS